MRRLPRLGGGAHVTHEARSVGQAWRQGALEAAVALLVVVAVWGGVHRWGVRVHSVPTGSMEPTLAVGDRMLVDVRPGGDVRPGDVVVLREPAGWRPETARSATAEPAALWRRVAASLGLGTDPGRRYLVKRVIAVGGQRVVCCDAEGRVSVDGRPLVEPYVAADGTPGSGPVPTGELRFDVEVPAGRLWLEGDHRAVSADSRLHGAAPAQLVEGVVRARVWPWPRVARLASGARSNSSDGRGQG